MKTYSISEAAAHFNMTPHTLRYYDKEGLLPSIERTPSGKRVFKPSDMDALRIIECLKASGMPIKEIKHFIEWCSEGEFHPATPIRHVPGAEGFRRSADGGVTKNNGSHRA